jgi:hypothetical protein
LAAINPTSPNIDPDLSNLTIIYYLVNGSFIFTSVSPFDKKYRLSEIVPYIIIYSSGGDYLAVILVITNLSSSSFSPPPNILFLAITYSNKCLVTSILSDGDIRFLKSSNSYY